MIPSPRSHRRIVPAWLAFAASTALAVAGCGGGDRAPTVPVAGKVVHRDGKPLTSGFVFLMPTSPEGLEATGQVRPDGTFRPESLGLDGAAPGDYRVKLADEPPTSSKGSRKKKAVGPPIDAKYLDEQTSGLTATVPPGGGSITIEID